MSFLAIEGLSKSYGSHEVLRDVSLNIDAHQVVCLIGASGCGKSTLLRCLNGLEQIDAGNVFVDGDPVHGEGVDLNRVRRRVGIVFQQYNLFPRLTALGNIMLAPRKVLGCSRREARQIGLELLDRVGLRDKGDAYPDRLSGGQQQRVAIARALAMRPQALLLDEVTSALDPELVGEVLDLVRDLAAGGMTLVLATHEMGFARDVADEICFLDGGRILEQGSPGEILVQPREVRTREFLGRIIAAGRL